MRLLALRSQVAEGHSADVLAADVAVRRSAARALVAALHAGAHAVAEIDANRFARTCVLFAVEDRAVTAWRAGVARTCLNTRTVTVVAALVSNLRGAGNGEEYQSERRKEWPTSESHQSSSAEDDKFCCSGVKRRDWQGQSTFMIGRPAISPQAMATHEMYPQSRMFFSV